MKYDFVFIILVYRNTNDLYDFFKSIDASNSKFIVVNSYYDVYSENEFKKIAEEYSADFISVPNRGYGAGNNVGCKYALENYSFDYLIISNADVNVLNVSVELLNDKPYGIYAPSIRTLLGKQQNPHMPYYLPLIDDVKYKLFCKNNWNGVLFFCAINKLLRYFFFFTSLFGARRVYSAHGAFVIIAADIVKTIYPFYDEDVFLFTEEENLAQLARRSGISTYFVPEINIRHKEDGSTSVISDKQRDITRDSFITYWKKWNINNKR